MSYMMAPEYQNVLIAGVDLNTSQYCVINLEGGLPANSADVAGVLQGKPKAGEAASVLVAGASKYHAAEAHTKGQKLMATTTGWCTLATSGHHVCGRALTSCDSGSINLGAFLTANMPYAYSDKGAL